MNAVSPNRWRKGRPDKALRVPGVKPLTTDQLAALEALSKCDGMVMGTKQDFERGRVSGRVAYALEVRGLITVYVKRGGDKCYTARIREVGRQVLAVLKGACCAECLPGRARCSS